MPDSPELIRRLKQQDAVAFEQLVRHYSPRLLAVIMRYMKTEADAHDALQDAWVQAYKSLPGFQERSALMTWLHSIAVRAALMKLRHNRRHNRENSIEDLLPKFMDDGHRLNADLTWVDDNMVDRNETREVVRMAIDELPESYRNVLLLRDIEELDTQKSAELLELTPNALKVCLHRARQALREVLKQKLAGAADVEE